MKPELEALYEGLCRQEPDLFEPESLHKQLDTLAPETLEALLQLCEDWQKHAFAVGFTACRPADDPINHRLSPLTQGRGLTKECRSVPVIYKPFYVREKYIFFLRVLSMYLTVTDRHFPVFGLFCPFW